MAEEFLHRPDVVAGFEQVRGERMTEGVAISMFDNAGLLHGLFDGTLD